MNNMKKQKDMTPKDKPPDQKMFDMLLGKSGRQLRIAPERRKQRGQSRNYVQLWMCLVVTVKSSVEKNNTA